MSIFWFNVSSCVHYRLKFIILCLYDAGTIASAPKGPKDSEPATASVIAGILDLQNARPDDRSTKQQDKPSSDLLAYQHAGEQQPGHVQPKAVVETMVIPAQDTTASKPTQLSEENSSAPTETETNLQTDAELGMMGQPQEEAAK